MKTELEVARDAVRSAGFEELADALEWAAAAVKHRRGLLSAARLFAAADDGECPDCGYRSIHDRKCATAAMLHALDAKWNRSEVDACHEAALTPSYGVRRVDWSLLGGPPLNARQAVMGAIDAHTAVDPDRLTYSAGTAWPIDRDRNALLSVTLETPRPLPNGVRVWDGQWPVAHADSPGVELPPVHQMALAPGPEGVARCGEPNPIWPPYLTDVTCPRCLALMTAPPADAGAGTTR